MRGAALARAGLRRRRVGRLGGLLRRTQREHAGRVRAAGQAGSALGSG
ncbi:hypothetical protein [Nonomuraea rubra]